MMNMSKAKSLMSVVVAGVAVFLLLLLVTTSVWAEDAAAVKIGNNSAYRLAWKHISELQKHVNSNIAVRLHDSIRCQLQEGATEPLFIAPRRLRRSMRSKAGTPKPQES
jgi:hypothetical protein